MRTFRLAAMLVPAVLFSACGQGGTTPTPSDATVDSVLADGGCAPVEQPPLQAGSHLIGDAEPPTAYSSTPPTSGWHSSGALDVAIHGEDDPLSEAAQVSVLEADGVVITYRDLPHDDLDALRALISERYDGQVALTPYAALDPGHVAMTAWGTLQRCGSLDLDVVTRFVEEHVGDDVAPGHHH